MLTSCEVDCNYGYDDQVGKGCGNFILYDRYDIDGYAHTYLYLNIDEAALNLNKRFQSFNVVQSSAISSAIEAYNMDVPPYCNDAIPVKRKRIHVWKLSSGSVAIRTKKKGEDCDFYLTDVILSNALFTDDSGNEIRVDNKAFENVMVGWYVG